ncbi:hypothetical protein SDC9_125437 [bioreactor metagenome]|uniref:Uncharacterized protein n=1 Tax=bioreactor metagenome TaxID=1076179 RepID=A0A645CN18_9ZZZZ
MDRREASRAQDRLGNLGGGDGAHAHHHGALQGSGGSALDIGYVHGDVPVLLDVAHRNARLEQGPLEGEGAPQEEAHKIVPPVFLHVRWFLDALPVHPHSVPGQIRGEVGAGSHDLRLRISRLGDVEDGAGFRVPLGEDEEIIGQILGQDHQVSLDVPLAHARRGESPLSLPDHLPDFPGRNAGVIEGLHPFSTSRIFLTSTPFASRVFRI